MTCKLSPTGSHCWHRVRDDSILGQLSDVDRCCFCGDTRETKHVVVHGKFMPRPLLDYDNVVSTGPWGEYDM